MADMPKAKQNEAEEPQPTGDDGDKPVKQQVREAFEAGKSRREIADEFEITYQRVYQLTKDMGEGAGGGQRPRVNVEASDKLTEAAREDLVGRPRVEVIRELFDEGMKVGDIARLLGTQYQVVFQATKAQRADASGEAVDTDTEDSEDLDTDADAIGDDEDEEDEDA
jgi:hypothetical protein